MPYFYGTGTIALTNGSATVTGTGTAFVANVRAGWALQLLSAGGDLTDYEIASVNSDTSLTLARAYQGTTGAGRAYQAKPTRGTELALTAALQTLITDYQAVRDNAGQGAFAAGSLATPGVRAATDTDSGLAWLAANVLALITGGVERLRVNSAGAQITGLLSGTAVVQSNADATAGRLLTTGYMGLGGVAPLVGNIGVTDGSIVPGIYAYATPNGSSGAPADVSRAALIHTKRTGTASETQTLIVEASSVHPPGTMMSRSRTSGAWSAWIFAGIAESGSNANGWYLRLPDGTQLARLTGLNLLSTGAVTWTFPIAFSAVPGIQITLNSSGLTNLSPRYTGATTTAADVSAVNTSNARVATSADLLAFGRWY